MKSDALLLVIADKNYSSWSMRPWLALRASGLDFKEEKILLDLPTTRERILKYSPSGRVPVLYHGDLCIWDSLAICEYVSEISPNGIWPEIREQRAHARSIVAEMHSGFASLRQQLLLDIKLQTKVGHLLPAAADEIRRILAIWSQCLAKNDGPFLFGQNFGIADAFYTPVVLRFRSYGISIKNKAILNYMNNIIEYAPVNEWIAEAKTEKNAEFEF